MTSTPQKLPMKKWMRSSSIHFFERNQDALSAPGFVSLSSAMIVKIMASGFEVITRDTFFITCRARQILSDNLHKKIYSEEEIFKAEHAINGHLEKLHEYFDTRIKQGEQKLQGAGFEIEEIQRLVSNYETLTVTNAVTQYLDLLSKADLYTAILHYLWLTSELSDNPDEAMRVKLKTEREIRENLFNITRFTQSQYSTVRRICNGVIEQRRLEREQQSERDRQRHLQKTDINNKQEQAKSPKPEKETIGPVAQQVIQAAQLDLNTLDMATAPA